MVSRRSALVAVVSAFVLMAWLAPDVRAQAKDASGTWKWTQQGFGRGRGQGRGGAGGAGGPATQPGAGGPATQPGAGAGGPGGGGGAGRAGGRGGQPTEITATLKQEGEKLTGSVVGLTFQDPTAKSDISEGSVKADGTVAFKVKLTGGQFEITRSFTGKLEGDKITGTSSFEFPNGGPGGPGGGAPGGGAPGGGQGGAGGRGGFGQPQEWVATRETAK